jgi:hypothetical protein
MENQLTEENKTQLIRLKQYFPYRIVFGVILPDGVFETYAVNTKHKLNKFLKLGYPVFQIEGK